jgi:hypothetical protein
MQNTMQEQLRLYAFAGDDNHTGSNDSQDFSIGKASSTVVTVWYPFIQVQHKLQLP